MRGSARELRESEKTMIAEWCSNHSDYDTGSEWPMVPDCLLSSRGFVGEADGVPTFVGWLYIDESSELAFMDWLISRPDSSNEERMCALGAMTDLIYSRALRHGATRIITASNHPGLLNKLERVGFFKTDSNITLMMRDR